MTSVGNTMLSVADDKVVRVWDMVRGKCTQLNIQVFGISICYLNSPPFSSPKNQMRSQFSHFFLFKDHYVAGTSHINSFLILALCTQHKVLRRPRPASMTTSLFMGATLVTGASDGGIHVVDTSSGVTPRPIVDYAAHNSQINCLTAQEGTIYSGGKQL
jgi:WD40 repeat protein